MWFLIEIWIFRIVFEKKYYKNAEALQKNAIFDRNYDFSNRSWSKNGFLKKYEFVEKLRILMKNEVFGKNRVDYRNNGQINFE